MQVTIHIDPNKPLLEVHSWLRSGGYRLERRRDGSLHAIPEAPIQNPRTGTVVPLRRPIPNPFGAA